MVEKGLYFINQINIIQDHFFIDKFERPTERNGNHLFREQLLEYTPRDIQLLFLNMFHVINYQLVGG